MRNSTLAKTTILRILIKHLFILVLLIGTNAFSQTYTYTNGLSFGVDVNGNVWNVWSANGSNIWDWHSDYINGYLHYSFKVYDYYGYYCSGSCRFHNIWTKNPTLGFEISDVNHDGAGFPESNQNNHIYQVNIQWNSSGYHTSVYDITDNLNYTEEDFIHTITATTYDSWTWGTSYWDVGYHEETAEEHAAQWFDHVYGDEVTGTSGGGGDIRTNALPVIETGIYIQPKIFITSGILNVNNTQTISGTGFSLNGLIKLAITNSLGDSIPINSSFTYLSNGGFSYQLLITSDMPGVEYEVYATDVTTNTTTSTIKFLVNNSTPANLVINKPALNDQYVLNQTISIQWSDFISKALVIGKTGYVTKTYKIELSKDNGNTWAILEAAHKIDNAVPGNFNTGFSSSCTIAATGTYIIRITDNDNPSDKNVSSSFKVVASANGGFDYSLVWDQSSPPPDMASPIGLAADGTSRIFVKLLRSTGNNKVVSKIKATIVSINDSYTTPDLLGKVTYAPNHTTYNEDGNNATSTSYTYPVTQNGNEFWFWLVAPDDFTHTLADERSERQIKMNFQFTYSDNSTETITTGKAPIYIVRTPLFLVHGLAGDGESFENFQYNVGTGNKFFANYGNGGEYYNPNWKDERRLTLNPSGSFAENAEIVLGTNTGDANYNSFQSSLKMMHSKGYACNRVDFVAHSMGGCVARTIINLYVESYKPPVNKATLYAYKNYSQGFINKLITLNTPHNGSNIADLVVDEFSNPLLDNIRALGAAFSDYFVQNGLNFKIAPAIIDLQGFNGGITFSRTTAKNHLIATDIDEGNNLSSAFLLSQTENKSPTAYNSLYHVLLPISILPGQDNYIHDFMLSHYANGEYLSNSDLIVPVSSQLPGKNSSDITDLDSLDWGATSASILYGITKNHTEVRGDIAIGTRVMHLLNSAINSSYFADDIAANPNPNGSQTYLTGKKKTFADSIKNYNDTAKIKIENPNRDSIVYVDSTISIQLNIKDTSNLQQVQLIFQGQLYSSGLKLSLQSFNIKVSPNQIGKDKVLAEAIYDSSGFTINHIDTITLNVKASGNLQGFYVSPESININPKQTFQPVYNAIYPHYVGILNNDIANLKITIADKNVIRYNKTTYQFTAQDTGTTYITFKYGRFVDTAYFYITSAQTSSLKQGIITSVSTTTIKNKNFISLSPNPAINKITLTSSKSGLAEIELIDNRGKTVKTFKSNFVSGNQQEIPLTDLAAGVYFVQVKIGDEIQNIKFVKSN